MKTPLILILSLASLSSFASETFENEARNSWSCSVKCRLSCGTYHGFFGGDRNENRVEIVSMTASTAADALNAGQASCKSKYDALVAAKACPNGKLEYGAYSSKHLTNARGYYAGESYPSVQRDCVKD